MVSVAQPVTPFFAAEDDRLVRSVERFLFAEADLLDRWQLHDWLELFGADGLYLVPSTDKPEGDPKHDLFLIQDDRFMLEHRVNSLLTRSAHAEYPNSRTRRMVSNVAAYAREDGVVEAIANFAVFRVRNGITDTYFGQYRHVLEPLEDGGFRFLVRKAVLDLDGLRPLGKISIIL
jgi:p-cumate 2,3-dioxygenase beta subunit